MTTSISTRGLRVLGVLLAAWLLAGVPGAWAKIDGCTGTTFNLVADDGFIYSTDGDSMYMWGYYLNGGCPGENPVIHPGDRIQYPGPTLIVNQGDTVTINLTNNLAEPTSIVFPGQAVTAAGGEAGLITRQAAAGGTVSYSFTADYPGTYLYRSGGPRAGLQVEMGLVGAIIVRPAMGAGYAYDHAETAFEREVLYLITEMDPWIHRRMEMGLPINMTDYRPTNWFINGRNFPDLLTEPGVDWLPSQPYNCVPMLHPGEKMLVRYIGGGRDLHPMHYHGNDFEVIAIDGRMLSTTPADQTAAGAGPDLAWKATTISSIPGQTADFIWTWNAEKLGWDVYGHKPGDGVPCTDTNGDDLDDATYEYCPDHEKPFPVILPPRDSLAQGELWPGSPFLGAGGDLPPGHPGLNNFGGYFFIWHSHTEKELTSDDIFPGGALSFVIVAPWNVPIE